MENIRIGICDDIDAARQAMLSLCCEYSQKNDEAFEYEMFKSGEEVIEYCNNDSTSKIDILFLDIEMDGISGIDLKENVLKQDKIGRISFVSSHCEQMRFSFSIKTIGFIKKPACYDDVKDILDKVLLEKKENISILFRSDNGSKAKVYVEDIRYIKADGRYTYIYAQNCIFCDSKISELEKKLTNSSVIRVHKSYMATLEYVTLGNGKLLIRDTENEIPIGRSYKEIVRKAYFEYGDKMARRRI